MTITARNTGKQAHGMVLVKLNDGVDDATLLDALKSHPDRIPNLLTYVGGTTALPTGTPWQATTSFDPGNYAMLDVGTSAQGRYNFTRAGEVQGFTVSGKANVAATANAHHRRSRSRTTRVDMPKGIAGERPDADPQHRRRRRISCRSSASRTRAAAGA